MVIAVLATIAAISLVMGVGVWATFRTDSYFSHPDLSKEDRARKAIKVGVHVAMTWPYYVAKVLLTPQTRS